MARFPRLVVPGLPHHITLRGARSLGEAHHRYALGSQPFGTDGPAICGRSASLAGASILAQDERAREEAEALRRHGRISRPLGSDSFVDRLEKATGRHLRPHKVGRKPKQKRSSLSPLFWAVP